MSYFADHFSILFENSSKLTISHWCDFIALASYRANAREIERDRETERDRHTD
jgi:hypothetical protein